MVKEILLLGDSLLYEKCAPIRQEELAEIQPVVQDLHDTLFAFRKEYKMGCGIAASQIGIRKRLFYIHINEPLVVINPVLTFPEEELAEVLDDCMSFPNLRVRVYRYKKVHLSYMDMNWEKQKLCAEGDFAALIQHEYDHLDGVLAIMRAVDNRSFFLK
ncbi:MAG: peptide deformylase [Oscillospiraceae bacterium]